MPAPNSFFYPLKLVYYSVSLVDQNSNAGSVFLSNKKLVTFPCSSHDFHNKISINKTPIFFVKDKLISQPQAKTQHIIFQ